jgi:hypothetical protein
MLRGLRFQKRLRLLPGVRINLSKSGVSTSIGPRGADVNIGPHGVSANAGIPGTGPSTRAKVSKPHSAGIGVVVLAVGLDFAAYKNMDRIAAWWTPAPAVQEAVRPAAQAGTAAATAQQPQPVARRARAPLKTGVAYVRRGGSVLRETEKTSGKTLKKYEKGAKVTVLAVDGPWSKVKDGALTGWMRSSILGDKPG